MGRTNRSRKRKDAMNRIKRERNAARELVRLKKTLGLIDADGNEVMKEVAEVATVKSAKELKKGKKNKESAEILAEIEDKGENIEVVNEKTGKKHNYNTKTMKDEYGSYPPWFKRRKTQRRQDKLQFARKTKFKQALQICNVPL